MTDLLDDRMRAGACVLCGESLGLPWPAVNGPGFHRVCQLRAAVGGIGHLEDHALWCTERGDPDGGRSYYQSALEVDEWVATFGVEAAVGRGND